MEESHRGRSPVFSGETEGVNRRASSGRFGPFSSPPGPTETHKVHTAGRVSSGERGPRQVTAESRRKGGIRGREGPLHRAKPRKTPSSGGEGGSEAGTDQPSCESSNGAGSSSGGGERAPKPPRWGGGRRSPQVRGLGSAGAAAGRLRATPLRRPGGGSGRRAPSPRAAGGGRGGGGRAPGAPQPEGPRGERVGAPQSPAPPPPRQRRGGRCCWRSRCPEAPRRRVSSSLPLSGASVGGCPAAASWSARSPSASLPHVASRRNREGEGGFFSRLIPSPFFFNGGHRDESRGPPAALSLAGAPSRGPAQRWPPLLVGEGGCSGAARPPGAASALESSAPSSLGGRHLTAAPSHGAAGCAAAPGAAALPPRVRVPPPRQARGRWAPPPGRVLLRPNASATAPGPVVALTLSWASPRGCGADASHAATGAGQPGVKVRVQTVPAAGNRLARAPLPCVGPPCSAFPEAFAPRGNQSIFNTGDSFPHCASKHGSWGQSWDAGGGHVGPNPFPNGTDGFLHGDCSQGPRARRTRSVVVLSLPLHNAGGAEEHFGGPRTQPAPGAQAEASPPHRLTRPHPQTGRKPSEPLQLVAKATPSLGPSSSPPGSSSSSPAAPFPTHSAWAAAMEAAGGLGRGAGREAPAA
ncbi:collagen alpha-1(I) chain-like [Colius striatus]|uniref:collagen alpha-1(I) chain-like n=1 Tax=Colius striatus TaxID=57412 RepID=UPI002B1D8B6C|nr:collagen alpha-1(I) chain-like [Colius striatus]